MIEHQTVVKDGNMEVRQIFINEAEKDTMVLILFEQVSAVISPSEDMVVPSIYKISACPGHFSASE